MVVVNRGDVKAGAVAEDDMYSRCLHICGSVKTISNRIGTSAGYHADRKPRSRQVRLRIIGVDLSIPRSPQHEAVDHLGEGTISTDADHRLQGVGKG